MDPRVALTLILVTCNAVSVTRAQATQIQEPGIIVVEPSPPVHTQGGKLSLTCVAYGEPELPTIIWSAPSLGVSDFSEDNDVNATIYTSILNDTELGLVFVISILEICDVNYTYSFINDFSCHADNGISESTIANNVSSPFTMRPLIYEPASLLVAPSSGQFISNGPRISATCAAYGSPIPSIQWTQAGEVITQDSYTNIYTQTVEDQNGDILVISTLELCDSVFIVGTGNTTCTTVNGVEDREGRVWSATFTIDPRTALQSFMVQLQGDTAQFNFSFSAPLTLNGTRCFLDKFKIVSSDATSEFQPLYPGLCQDTNNSNTVVAFLDPRDFRLSLNFFTSIDMLRLVTVPGMEIDFIPLVSLLPITNPMTASALIHNSAPRLFSFDVDFNAMRVLLHFTDYMNISSFESQQLVLVNRDTGVTRPLSFTSRPMNISNNHVRTICVTLDNQDAAALTADLICNTTPENCACYFTSNLVSSFSGVPVQAVARNLPLPVSKLKFSPPDPDLVPPLYLQLSLRYDGCTATYNLTQDEVYVLRTYETVTRIECFSSGQGDNVNPVLSFDTYEGPLSFSSTPVIDSSIVLDWPRRAYFDFTNGLPPQNFGLFVCSTRNTTIQHYIYNMTRYLALPNGDTYTARLYDSITIPFILGSDPFLDIRRSNVQITMDFVAPNGTIQTDPVYSYRRLSGYRGEVHYNQTLLSRTRTYLLRIFIFREIVTYTYVNIIVNPPTVSVIPPILALLPSDTRLTLQCVTNSEALPVMWMPVFNSMSDQASYTLSIPPQGGFADGQRFYCRIRDPEIDDQSPSNVVGSAFTIVRNIPDELVVLNSDDEFVENLGSIIAYGNFSLQCIGHSLSQVVDLVWITEETGQAPVVLREEDNNDYTMVSYDFNAAYLVINNLIRPYQGTLSCRSQTADMQVTIYVNESKSVLAGQCESGDVDPIYEIEWDEAAVNSSNGKPCPNINGRETQGIAFRHCMQGNVWDTFVNVSNCRTPEFANLREFADSNVFSVSENLPANVLRSSLSMLTNQLMTLTTPGNFSLLPLDLEQTNYMLENIISRLPDDSLETGIVSVMDNLLEPINEDGWIELNKIGEGSRQLLENIENYAAYILTVQEDSNTRLSANNIILSAQEVQSTDIMFPSNINAGGYLKIPVSVLNEQQATGVVNALIQNLPMFLPQPESLEENKRRRIGSVILSTQIISPSEQDFESGFIELNYNTTLLRRAQDPKCAFWNESTGQWDDRGVSTEQVRNLETGEYKSYTVNCRSSHATAFAVILDLETEEFDFTIPVYVGCGLVLFSAAMSIFSLFLSCLIDKLRVFSVVSHFTHMSFCVSLILAFVGFLAGIESALDSESGCIAAAAILHFFFTAAFSWLFCESLLLIFYPFFSKHCSAFILLFLLGWTLPAIPTAITLGLIRDEYITSQSCWFFFDGMIENEIVLAFIVPKLILIAATLLALFLGCITTQVRSNKTTSRPYIHMLRFISMGIVLLLALLALTWIFAVLLVNVYGINSTTTGWVFLGACILLAIWLFLFNIVVSIISQKVDYTDLWSTEATDYVDKKKGKSKRRRAGEYEMMSSPYQQGNIGNTLINVDPNIMENPLAQVYDGDVAVVNTTTKDDQADEIPIGEDLKEDLLKLEP